MARDPRLPGWEGEPEDPKIFLKMAYIYLLDIYKLIDQRIECAKNAMENGSGDPTEKKYQEGRIKVLTDFKDYLTTHFHPKLPLRIRQSYKVTR